MGAGFKPALAQTTPIRRQLSEKALDRIRAYIANNPARVADDPEKSRERFLPKQGGFETRLQISRLRRAAALLPSAQALFDCLTAPA